MRGGAEGARRISGLGGVVAEGIAGPRRSRSWTFGGGVCCTTGGLPGAPRPPLSPGRFGRPGSGGGAPLCPGTGRALVFGNSRFNGAMPGRIGALPGGRFAGVTPGALGLIDALGGGGNLPCWISVARCSTRDGKFGPRVAGPDAPALRGPAAAAIAAGVGAGLLITVLMTVVLWMLL